MAHECRKPTKGSMNGERFICQAAICRAIWGWHEMTGWRWFGRSS